jgi:hypothetical protein
VNETLVNAETAIVCEGASSVLQEITIEDDEELDEITQEEENRRVPLNIAQMKITMKDVEACWSNMKLVMEGITKRQQFNEAKYDSFRHGSLVLFFRYCCNDGIGEVKQCLFLKFNNTLN